MAKADNFAIEHGKAEEVVQWINEYAKRNNQKFEAELADYHIQTIRFGKFQVMAWKGDWSVARTIMKKASFKTKSKVIEAGFHEQRDLISAFFGGGVEYAKVYSAGKVVGQLELESRSGKWHAKAEAQV
ncbi:MAG: hypothetical protein ABI361_05060 [Nitrososphaera sp.]|jgi:hypothetical protein